MGEVVTLDQLLTLREELKQKGKKVVFTNGCFDLLHRGHIECLKKAKEMGDVLVVGLNSDSSVKALKGEKRPILTEVERAVILSSLSFVDYVVLFSEETPESLIGALVPDVLVKGGDYRIEEIVGRETVWQAGGDVVCVSLVEGCSTDALIQRIVESHC